MPQSAIKLLLILTLAGSSLSSTAQIQGYWPHPVFDSSYQDVSLIQLIANPQAYDGKRVRLIGFLRIEFEGDAIYLHKEDFDYAITRNALWIDIPEDMRPSQKELVDLHYVLCEGTFRAGRHGQMGLFSGELSDVQRLQSWADHPRPKEMPPPPPGPPQKK